MVTLTYALIKGYHGFATLKSGRERRRGTWEGGD